MSRSAPHFNKQKNTQMKTKANEKILAFIYESQISISICNRIVLK